MFINAIPDALIRNTQVFSKSGNGYRTIHGTNVISSLQAALAFHQLLLLGLPCVHSSLMRWQLVVWCYIFLRCKMLHHMERIIKPYINRREWLELTQSAGYTPCRNALTPAILWQLQLRHIQQCIHIPGEYARSSGTVHAALPALVPLAVVMAIDHCTIALGSDPVKVAAKLCHLIGIVLASSQHLVNRVDDNGNIAFLLRPTDQLRGQLVQRLYTTS